MKKKNLYPNLDPVSDDIFAVLQPVGDALAILDEHRTIPKEELEKLTAYELTNGDQTRGLKVTKDEKNSLEATIIEKIWDIRDPMFRRDILALFNFAHIQGSFKFNEVKVTDIMRATGAYKGKQIDPGEVERFMNNVNAAWHTSFKSEVPEIKYLDKRGRTVVYKAKKNEILESYTPLLTISETASRKNSRVVTKIWGELLPKIENKQAFRALAYIKTIFQLDMSRQKSQFLLASYFAKRFSQSTDRTIKNIPIKINRRLLIEIAGYETTEGTNSSRASELVYNSLNTLQDLKLIAKWENEEIGTRIVSNDPGSQYLIYAPKDIMASLKSRNIQIEKKKATDFQKKLSRLTSTEGVDEVAKDLKISIDELIKLQTGELVPDNNQKDYVFQF